MSAALLRKYWHSSVFLDTQGDSISTKGKYSQIEVK